MVTNLVGNEPSPPNSLRLDKRPSNPFVSAGALVVANLLQTKKDSISSISNVLTRFSSLSSSRVSCSMPAYLHLQENASRDAAIAYGLKSTNVLASTVDVAKLLNFHYQISCVEVNCSIGSQMVATLANNGVNPVTQRKCFDSKSVGKLSSVLSVCSAVEGGVSAASANGVLLLLFPNMGLVIYSPGLDSKSEVSARGLEFAKLVVQKLKSK